MELSGLQKLSEHFDIVVRMTSEAVRMSRCPIPDRIVIPFVQLYHHFSKYRIEEDFFIFIS